MVGDSFALCYPKSIKPLPNWFCKFGNTVIEPEPKVGGRMSELRNWSAMPTADLGAEITYKNELQMRLFYSSKLTAN